MAVIACHFFFYTVLQFENFVASLVAHASHIQEQFVTEVTENYETTCWGCGLRVLLPSCASAFKCGWCGAITDQNKMKRDQKCIRWRVVRDRCFVSVVLVFMFFVICKSLLFLLFLLLFIVIVYDQTCFYFPQESRCYFQISPPFPCFYLLDNILFYQTPV